MRPEDPNQWPPDPKPSEAFSHDLKAAYQPPQAVPGDVDRKILRMAWHQLAAQTSSGRARSPWRMRKLVAAGTISAAAAAVVLLVWAGAQGPGSLAPGTAYSALPPSVPAAEQTSILHAFALARELGADRRVHERWDVDGDGHVDQRDVDTLARRAVALNRRGDV